LDWDFLFRSGTDAVIDRLEVEQTLKYLDRHGASHAVNDDK
jgi:hypothetical protein